MRWALALALAVALVLVANTAGAANILFFDPASAVTGPSGQLHVDLNMDFMDSTSGGGIVITYDPGIVDLSDITFDPTFPSDPDFSCPGSTVIGCPPNPNFISFGDLGGIVGQYTIAALTFDAVGLGDTGLSATIVDEFDNGSGTPLFVSVMPGSLEVVVPEPGTGILIALSLVTLAAGGRRG